MWESDLAEAQQLEDRLAEIFRNNYPCKEVVTSSSIFGVDTSFPEWDIKIVLDDDSEVLVELKSDKLADTTGNIAIEFGKVTNDEWIKTGISVSQSTVWVQYFSQCFYAIETETLRKMIENKEYSRIQVGGKNRCTRFYLFPVELFKKLAIVIN